MKTGPSRFAHARALVLFAVAGLGTVVPAAVRAQAVATWESSIATLETPSVSGQTVRQYARISVGGSQLRLRFSNRTGLRPLTVSDAHVALPGSAPGSIQVGTGHAVTFNGAGAATLAPGADVISDAVDMPVQSLTRLAVSAYFRTASPVQVGHFLASETNVVAPGDHATEATMPGATPSDSGFYLAGISASLGNLPGGVVACLGDSITDGLSSTPDADRRWPDRLAERLLAASQGRIGAINAGLLGNSMLQGTESGVTGASALARLPRDVVSRPGVRWLILYEGINDIINPPDAGDTAAELIAAYGQVIAQAHEAGVKVFGATLTPFAGAGHGYYSASKEALRQRVNAWIRDAGAFDAVFDFDAVVRDPGEPRRLLPAYDSDHIHPNDAGYAALANAVPLGTILRGR